MDKGFRRMLASMLFCVATAWAQGSALQKADAWTGTWKLNSAKSKYSPGPAPKTQVFTMEPQARGFKVAIETVPKQGATVHRVWVANFDGKGYPIEGDDNADTYTYRFIDDKSYQRVSKKAGNITVMEKHVISADGRSRTVTATGYDAHARPVRTVAFFEKQ